MLRVRLILWYTLLVGMTVAAIGFAQYYIIHRSLIEALDQSLMDDARNTLSLVNNLPDSSNVESIMQHSRMHSSGSLREMIDHVLITVPDSLHGDALADRVMSRLIDEILSELSDQDERGRTVDPLDAIAERTLSGRRNNLVEIRMRTPRPTSDATLFKTENLGGETISNLLKHSPPPVVDTPSVLGDAKFKGEKLRVARAANQRFVVYVGFPVTDINESLARLVSSFWYLVPLALLISAIGGLWLARKALRPIEQVAETAQEISAKNLSRRIALPGKTDRELTQLTTTLNSMFERLETSFRQISQFTSDASHELKTPLAIMKGEIEQAQRHLENGLSEEESYAMLTSLMEEVERMQRIVEGLLLLSRADDRKLPLNKQHVVLHDYLSSLAEDGEILAEERELSLKTELDAKASDAVVNVDSTRFYQVIMNLLDNALKYTPRGGTVTLFLSRSRMGAKHAVEFGVRDTGIGIAKEDRERVFQRFFRTDEARTGPHEDADRSLGLGLAIVKSIVEAHDGKIRVESEPGVGTAFIITLPTVEKEQPHLFHLPRIHEKGNS